MDYLSITIQRFKESVNKALLHQEQKHSDYQFHKDATSTLYGLLIDFGITQVELGEMIDKIRENRKNKFTRWDV